MMVVPSFRNKINVSHAENPQKSRITPGGFKAFAARTSCHGFGDLYRSQTIRLRVFWCLTIVSLIGVGVYFLSLEVYLWSQARTKTSLINIWESASLSLPNIGICDFEGLNMTQLLDEGFPNDTDVFDDVMSYRPNLELTTNKTRLQYIEDVVQNFTSPRNLSNLRLGYAYSANLTLAYTNARLGQLCTGSNCWLFQHMSFQNCRGITVRPQERVGVTTGVHLTVTRPVDPERLRRGLASAGFVVELFPGHSPINFNPFIIQYGTLTYISVEKEIIRRVRQISLRQSDLCRPYPDYGGSCDTHCMAAAMHRACGCVMMGQWVNVEPANTTQMGQPRYCGRFESKLCVLSSKFAAEQEVNRACTCKPKCEETIFKATITSVAISDPSDPSLLQLIIGYPDLRYTVIEQSEAYETTTLLSNVGGQLGLWLGMSVASIFQMCVLCSGAGGAATQDNKGESACAVGSVLTEVLTVSDGLVRSIAIPSATV